VSAWVIVDEAGIAATVSPVTGTTNGGATTTFNPPPATLLATGTYTLLPSGIATTKTGLAPVATATGKGDAGIFLACDKYQGPGGPFCQPEPGTVLYVGYTYYVTWTPRRFSSGSAKVAVQLTPEDGKGTTSDMFPVSRGFWAWTIDDDFLRLAGRESISVELSLLQDDDTTPQDNDAQKHTGPTVYVTYPPPLVPVVKNGNGPSVVAIAVPVVVAVVVLLLAGLCFWSWRRHGTVPIVGALGKVGRRSSGYGVRKSASERVGRGVGGGGGAFGAPSDKPGPNINIQLTDRDSWSPTGTGSRNVFREEMQRQERHR